MKFLLPLRLLAVLLLFPAVLFGQKLSPPEDQVLSLWPGEAPGEPEGFDCGEEIRDSSRPNTVIIRNVSVPTLHVYRPATVEPNGACVLVAPGGGYGALAIGHEGSQVAAWLNSLGVTAAVLKYRVPRRHPEKPYLQPLMDAQRAMRLLRHHAEELGVDAGKVGMLGFSAGGNLTVFTGTSNDKATYESVDEADELSARPDFLVTIYPAYMQESKPLAVDASTRVDAQTPPTFIAVSHDDVYAPSSVALYTALNRVKVAAEMHVYPDGGHGWGMGKPGTRAAAWPTQCAAWLRGLGVVTRGEKN